MDGVAGAGEGVLATLLWFEQSVSCDFAVKGVVWAGVPRFG